MTRTYNYHAESQQFTGKERDPESGLSNFGARFDASSTGRFLSPDPIKLMAQKLVDPQQWRVGHPFDRTFPGGLPLLGFERVGRSSLDSAAFDSCFGSAIPQIPLDLFSGRIAELLSPFSYPQTLSPQSLIRVLTQS